MQIWISDIDDCDDSDDSECSSPNLRDWMPLPNSAGSGEVQNKNVESKNCVMTKRLFLIGVMSHFAFILVKDLKELVLYFSASLTWLSDVTFKKTLCEKKTCKIDIINNIFTRTF